MNVKRNKKFNAQGTWCVSGCMFFIHLLCSLMDVLFHISFTWLHVYAFAIKSKVHCGSAFEPGASGFLYYCTPPVCVPNVIAGLTVCVLLCFIELILGNRYVRSRGFIVSELRETHPRSEIADVPTSPCPPLDNLGCPEPHPPPLRARGGKELRSCAPPEVRNSIPEVSEEYPGGGVRWVK